MLVGRNPPERALAPNCYEKIQIQALNRTQPGLPTMAGRVGVIVRFTLARTYLAGQLPSFAPAG